MHTLTVRINEKKDFLSFRHLINHLDYVEIEKEFDTPVIDKNTIDDLAGIWKKRDISLNDIRKKAWKEKQVV